MIDLVDVKKSTHFLDSFFRIGLPQSGIGWYCVVRTLGGSAPFSAWREDRPEKERGRDESGLPGQFTFDRVERMNRRASVRTKENIPAAPQAA